MTVLQRVISYVFIALGALATWPLNSGLSPLIVGFIAAAVGIAVGSVIEKSVSGSQENEGVEGC